MSHTPGPWAAHEGWPSDIWHVDMPGRAYSIGVSRADSDEDMTVEEVQANARLIAAAPDLLAALIRMDEEFGTQNYTKSAADAVIMAEAAIKKATGGQ